MEAAQARESWERYQRGALIVGSVGIVVCVLGAIFRRQEFFQAYLFAYVFWLGIALGCLGILMLHNLSGGSWGVVIRRSLESGMKTLPMMAVLFLPLIFGLHHLYEWARPEDVAHDPLLQHKAAYLNRTFFLVRAVIYFALWIGAALMMARWSAESRENPDGRAASRLRAVSGPALVLYVLTITFASMDWIMSLEPHWYSTIYGVHFFGGHGLAAFAFTIVITAMSLRTEVAAPVPEPAHWLDLGNLLLGFVMLWAYFAFSQWLIIWSGNLPEEAVWYTHRNSGGWEWLARLLAAFHFFVPFLLLLSRRNKRRAVVLAIIAGGVLLMRLVDIFWYTVPAFRPGELSLHWMDIAAPVALGGIWLAVFFWQWRRTPVLIMQHHAGREVSHYG
jgi:hypothetical protein